jgi:hypothetical protein
VVREAEFCTPAGRPGKNAESQTAHLAFRSLPTGVGAPDDIGALKEIDRLIDAREATRHSTGSLL